MPRPPRDLAPGLFHVYTHSVWAANALFRDDDDRLKFLRELGRATRRIGWKCLAFCVMGTHYHLVLDVPAGGLAKGMHYLNFRYATHFNERHAMKGHVHGRRYDARRIQSPAELLVVVKYVAQNPPKAGLCEKPEDWRFSSYAGTIGLREQESFVDDRLVLGCFEGPDTYARAALRNYVDNA
jgi:REP element-mobilizing transposase RayT